METSFNNNYMQNMSWVKQSMPPAIFLILLLLLLPPSSPNQPSLHIATVTEGNLLTAHRVSLFTSTMPPNLTVDAAKYLDAREASDQFTPLPLSHYVFQTEQTRQHHDKNHPESTQHYRDLPSPPSLSIGIISAYNNTGHRLAARSTWLTTNPGSLATVHKFFIAEPEGGIGQLPQRVLWEAVLYDDIIILPFTDSYSKTPIKSVALYNWGVTVCGAWYVLRANDDVYLDLRGVMETAYSVVPSRVMAGLVIDGSSMRIPRPEHHGLSGRSGQKELLEKHRAWTFLREDWPCDRVPTFVQGNAVLLSQDLAFAVGKLKDEPWR